MRALVSLFLVFAALVAGGGPVAAQERRVAAVEFLPDRVGPYRFADLAAVRAGDPLGEDLLERNLRLLRETGLFEEVAGEVRVEPDGARVIFRVKPRLLVTDVRVRGNFLILDSDLIPLLRLRPAEPFREETLRGDVERLRRHYEEAGFSDTLVAEEVSRADGQVRVTYRVREGRPEVVGPIRVAGSVEVPAAEVVAALGLARNSFFRAAALQRALDRVRDFYQDRGYLDARVEARTEKGGGGISLGTILSNPIRGLLTLGPEGYRVVSITLDVNEGKRYEIQFRGEKTFGEGALRPLLTFRRTGFFDEEEIAASRRRILEYYQEHGYYLAEVDVTADYDAGRVVFSILEHEPVRVASVNIRGVTHFEEGWLLARLAVRSSGGDEARLLRAKDLERDRSRLRSWYHEAGFAGVEVSSPEVWPDALPAGAEVVFTVREGQRTLVRSVSFEGGSAVPLARLREAAAIQEGAPYLVDRLVLAAERVRTAAVRSGFGRAKVNPRADFSADRSLVDLVFVVREGPLQRLGAIAVIGNRKTRRNVIRREVPLAAGDPLDPEALAEGRLKLYDLGLFREVRYLLPAPVVEGAPQDVVLAVRERPSGFVGFGAGYASDEEWRGFVEIGEQNLFGTGRGVRAKSKLSTIGYRHDFFYQEPWLFNYDVKGQADLYVERERDIGYDVRRRGITLGVNKELSRSLLLNLRYRYEFVNYSNVQPDIALTEGPLEQLNISSVIGVFDWDLRDNPLSPRRGSHHLASVEVARPSLGGDTSFTKYQVETSWYLRLGAGAELALALRGGFTQLLLTAGHLPLSERFFLGGDSSVRGYGFKQVGPKDAAGNPLGGNVYAVGNLELRFTLHKRFRGVVFLDAGEIWAEQAGLPASGVKLAVGPGLRYDTLIGPIRLDWGYKLDREPGESPSRWHLTIGYPF